MDIAQQSFLNLQEAITADDREAAELQFLIGVEAWSRIWEERKQAEQCVGGETAEKPELKIEICEGHEPSPRLLPRDLRLPRGARARDAAPARHRHPGPRALRQPQVAEVGVSFHP